MSSFSFATPQKKANTKRANLMEALDESLARASAQDEGSAASRVFTVVLFAFIVLFLLGCIWIASVVYRDLYDQGQDIAQLRASNYVIANVINSNDSFNFVSTTPGPEGDALVLSEDLESGSFRTYIYLYNGNIVSEYVVAGTPLDPTRAEVLAPSNSFDFEIDSNRVYITTEHGTSIVSMHSAQGRDIQDAQHAAENAGAAQGYTAIGGAATDTGVTDAGAATGTDTGVVEGTEGTEGAGTVTNITDVTQATEDTDGTTETITDDTTTLTDTADTEATETDEATGNTTETVTEEDTEENHGPDLEPEYDGVMVDND